MITQHLNKNSFFNLLLLLLFIISYFEYFFRGSGLAMLGLELILVLSGFLIYGRELKLKDTIVCYVFIFGSFVVCLLQTLSNSDASVFFGPSQVVYLFAFLILGIAVKERILELFVSLMLVISLYSIILYGICFFFPSVKEFLMTAIAPKCVSLGAERALQEGGGINIIIYNFQLDSPWIKISRNCGPFWEPGMFAVFVNIALFINVFFLQKKGISNVIFVIALLTTMSTGGYIGGLFVIACYVILKKGNIIVSGLILALLVALIIVFMSYDLFGEKLLLQMSNASVGSDESRFGALMTHFKIFCDHPLWGYFGLKGYANETDTLASGLLVPLSSRGVFVGGVFYYLLYRASVNYSFKYTNKKRAGVCLFILILLLSFSQTILMTSCFLVFVFAGQSLYHTINYNRYATV